MWECSHIGGDRFAGNLLRAAGEPLLGACTGADAERILTGLDEDRLDLANLRGRSTLTLVEQAAEHFTRTELGLDALDADGRRARRRRQSGGDRSRRRKRGRRRGRRIPSTGATPLTCKGAEGLTYPSFRLARAIERRA